MYHEIFYMVWNENGRAPTRKHTDLVDAKKEAERLALLNPNDTMHVLACIGTVKLNNFNWTQIEVDDLPF